MFATLLLSLACALPPQAGEPQRPTPEEALALAFPGCRIERHTEYLTRDEAKHVEELARAELEGRVVRPYVATRDGKLVGTAYLDLHRVRTKNELLLLVVSPEARLERIEVLSFAEPEEYRPKAAFYAQFKGKRAGDELVVGRDVRGVAGATLSAEATSAAARRVLTLHRFLAERAAASAR